MYLKKSLFVTLLAMFALTACGGADNSSNAMAAEPMGNAEPATEPVAGTAQLGGGTAVEVHPGTGGSPHAKVDWSVEGANISITYGRPFLKDRVVGESVDPMGDQVWRLGADEATTLVTDRDLMLGSAHVPAGEYTLFTQRMDGEFHLIVNSETGQWGLSYNAEHDVAHTAMEVSELDPPADQLTFVIEDGSLGFEWGQMKATVPLMVH